MKKLIYLAFCLVFGFIIAVCLILIIELGGDGLIVSGVVIAGMLFGMWALIRWQLPKEQQHTTSQSIVANSFSSLIYRIDVYLKGNTDSEFFLTGMKELKNALGATQRQINNALKMLSKQDDAEQSHIMIDTIRNHLISVATATVEQMEQYDSVSITQTIRAAKSLGQEEEVAGYLRLEKEYRERLTDTLKTFSTAKLKLQQLLNEKGRFTATDSTVFLESLDQLTEEVRKGLW